MNISTLKANVAKLRNVLLTTGLALMTSSCYLNTASHIFALGGYDATFKYNRNSNVVMQDGSDYYIELERYKKPIVTQYNMLKDSPPVPDLESTGQRDLFKIDSAYAKYLLGQSGGASSPSMITRVTNESVAYNIAAQSTKHPMARPVLQDHKEHVTYPTAPLWYTLGALDWVCVDMPVTLVENVLSIYYIFASVGGFDKLKQMGVRPNY